MQETSLEMKLGLGFKTFSKAEKIERKFK